MTCLNDAENKPSVRQNRSCSTTRLRKECPSGHQPWELTNYNFCCQECARLDGVDGVFLKLHNQATGNLVERDNPRLETRAGAYESTEGSV